MIESIKTALASWLKAEVFALVGEAMKDYDADRADMLTEIDGLKRENRNLLNDMATMHDDLVNARRLGEALKVQVDALCEEVAECNGPSAQQVADCISRADLRKALQAIDLSEEVKGAVEHHIDEMDLEDEIKEAIEKKLEDDSDIISDVVTSNILGRDDIVDGILKAVSRRLSEAVKR